MIRIGFSVVGAIFLAALFVPDLVRARHPPADYDASEENRALRLLERGGQVLTSASALLLADTNPRPWTAWSWWLVAGHIDIHLGHLRQLRSHAP